MTRSYFGTDGIRGAANSEPMTATTALKVGMAAGQQFLRGSHRHRVVIGKDTRLSGYLIEPALTAGFISVGMDVILVGPMPTPAIAMLTRSLRADLGVMISASHNTYEDNGIKLFGPDGFKLSDAVEKAIEARMDDPSPGELDAPDKLGRAQRLDDAQGRYIEFAKNAFPKGRRLDGLKIVIDCANGAAYKVAPTVLWELEAEVVTVGVEPNGYNINKGCGSTNPEALQSAVVTYGADIGIALDGDADRLVMADEKGHLIDGDQVLALIAERWQAQGRLSGGGVVATVMSNLGLERHLAGLGLGLERTQVGDRYVLEAMRSGGFNVGGEQSGHVILTDYCSTGDGLIAALQVLAALAESGQPASSVCRRFTALPQVLRSVRHGGGEPLRQPDVTLVIDSAQRRIGKSGRLVIRPSGTEPLIRVMAQGENETLIVEVVDEIVEALSKSRPIVA
jgi:phosphoglucosamine mutase